MSTKELPVIDLSIFYGPDGAEKDSLLKKLQHACKEFGFFQLINHGIPRELQESMFSHSKAAFDLPMETKEKYSKDLNDYNRGYERLRAQNFEKRAEGDLKEGYYFAKHLPLDHPDVVAKKFNQGPNMYPAEVADPDGFRKTIDQYFECMTKLSRSLLSAIALTLGLESSHFDPFCETPPVVALLRLLHYPPQEPDASEFERGIGAHTDFGAITILMQDATGGLQVWDSETRSWIDVTPVPGAFVVNLGNMMMNWTNDMYLSNLHRVINKSGNDRISVPFFFDGNADFEIKCLPVCEDPVKGAKYPPIKVHEIMTGRYADTYGKDKEKAIGERRMDYA